MNIHEFQAKQLLLSINLPVPKGFIYNKNHNIESLLISNKEKKWVVKSQIHAGGRGAGHFLGFEKSGGGVRLLDNLEDVKKTADFMLGKKLITKQTGPLGKEVNLVYIEESTSIKKEYYISLIIDRRVSKIMLIASQSGGMEIEEVALREPNKIFNFYFDNLDEIKKNELEKLSQNLFFTGNQTVQFSNIIEKLLKLFKDFDASSIEINPLVIDNNNNLILLDAKMSFDDNALYRNPDILKLKDDSEEDPLELQASKKQMNYIKLDGSIGCMVNGAGLAMATMDIIKFFGSEPANFLDLGGTANKERAKEGFKIIQSDPKVRSILVNIFGGIIHCDMIAEGIIDATKELNLKLPIIVRFQGTKAKEGKDMINNSNLNIIAAESLNDAAKKSVEASL